MNTILFYGQNSNKNYKIAHIVLLSLPFTISPLLLLATPYTRLFFLFSYEKSCSLRNGTESVNPCIVVRSYINRPFTKIQATQKTISLFLIFLFLQNLCFFKIFMKKKTFFKIFFNIFLNFQSLPVSQNFRICT